MALRFISQSSLRLVLLLALVLGLTMPAAATSTVHAQTATDFGAACSAIRSLDGTDGIRLGVVLQDLKTGEQCTVRADESFRTASLYKLVILAEAHRQQSLGLISFDDPLLIEPRHAIDDPVELRPTFSSERPIGEAVRRMIQSSANADALALYERLGVQAADALPATIGMESTVLGSEFVTTPDDIATYFAQLYRGELLDRASSEAMLETLSGQLLTDLIPEPLPDDVTVAHKTGLLDDYLHDAGLVYAPGGDYVLVAMTEHPFAQEAATELIRQVSVLAFQPYALAAGQQPLRGAAAQRTESDPEVAAGVIAGFEAGLAAADGTAPRLTDPLSVSAIPTNESGLTPAGIPELGLREGALGAIAISILAALLGVFTYGFRLRRRQAPVYNREAVNAVAGDGERTTRMRIGIRKAEQDEAIFEDEGTVVPASQSITEVEPQPVMPSPRLQRMAEFFASQQHLLGSIQQQYEDEMQPLNALLDRQGYTQQRLLSNLETRLRPLNEYADGEEANLDALEQRMIEQGPDFIQRSFSEYLGNQRQRITDTRDQIDEQRLPLMRYGEEQRDAIEVALSRFDADVEALELNLAEQRKLLMRMLDAMRSDSFVAVKHFLDSRETTMSELADSGITDPGQIGKSVQNLRDAVDAMSSQSVHIQSVLETTDRADEQLVESSPGGGPYALPSIGSFEDALAELDAVESEEAVTGA